MAKLQCFCVVDSSVWSVVWAVQWLSSDEAHGIDSMKDGEGRSYGIITQSCSCHAIVSCTFIL